MREEAKLLRPHCGGICGHSFFLPYFAIIVTFNFFILAFCALCIIILLITVVGMIIVHLRIRSSIQL